MRRWPLFWQLAIGLSAMTGLLWLGAAAISAAVMNHAINEAYDYALEQAASRLLPLAVHDLREPNERHRIDSDESEHGEFSYVVRSRSGAIVLNDGELPEAILPSIGADGYFDTRAGRAYASTDRRSGFSIVVVEAESERHEALADGGWALLGPLVALLPLVAVGVWFALRLALAPLERLRGDLAERGRHNLAPLDPASYPPELAPIVGELAGLLDRLQHALDAERAFAASSAHELRTPIAGALAQTQLLAAELADHPAAKRTAEIEAALRRLARLAERLLQLSRLESGFARSENQVELLPIIRLVCRDFTSNGGRIDLEIDNGASPSGHVDADAFALLLRNLVDNAMRHGAPDKAVKICVDADGTIRVVNAGLVVPQDILSALGRPFVRGATQASGTGIGLSMVRSVVEQAGGSLTFHSPARGQTDGFEVAVRF